MKRLLLPLLAAIALPTFAGDLGEADYKYDPKRELIRMKEQDCSILAGIIPLGAVLVERYVKFNLKMGN